MELQKLLQDEIREGLYRITISGPRGDSEVSKVRIRPVEIKGKLLFQCQETVGTKEFHKNMTKDDVITRIRDWMNGTFKQMQLESDTCTASVLVSKKGTMTIKKKPHGIWKSSQRFFLRRHFPGFSAEVSWCRRARWSRLSCRGSVC